MARKHYKKPVGKTTPSTDQQVLLGVYRLAHVNVDVYVWLNNTGGEFYFAPDPTNVPRIKLGIWYDTFAECVNVLLHEALEFVLTAYRLRYLNSGNIAGGGDAYCFMYTHAEYTEAVAQTASFVAATYMPLYKLWVKTQKQRNK